MDTRISYLQSFPAKMVPIIEVTELVSYLANPPFSPDTSFQLQYLRNTKALSVLPSAFIFLVFKAFTHK